MARREMFTFAMLRKILFGVGSNSLPMERKELRHDRHMVSLLTDHMVFSPKYSAQGSSTHQEWCSKSLWAPSCFHGSVGHGWDVVGRYI